jgi:hypothetical protein
MEPLHLHETYLTPLIIFDPETSVLKVEGKMIPEDVDAVMGPLNRWLDNYLTPQSSLHVLFRLYYYNTSSSRQFFVFCRKLDESFRRGANISVRWEYEEGDDESKADAEEFLGGVHFPYEIVEVTE